jgi:FSR family fosmidomycin resistance protein-like MFS transporter
MVAVYSVAHFLVDFACAFLIFRMIIGTTEVAFCILLYNFCAFAMQMPLGLLADRLNRNALCAGIGCLLIATAFCVGPIPVSVVILLGLGNALFHLGGGIDVLNVSERRSGPLGVFVSPGALGLFLGALVGRAALMPVSPLVGILMLTAGALLAVRRLFPGAYRDNAVVSIGRAGSSPLLMVAVCLFLVVIIRSFVGLSLDFPWKSLGHWGILLVGAVVLGKTAGGFLADRFGPVKVSSVSLGLAAVLFLVSPLPIAGLLAVFAFNMTMPITLWAMAKEFPGARGFSFGLLTFGLFLGFLPVHLGVGVPEGFSGIFPLLSILSLVLLVYALRKAKR